MSRAKILCENEIVFPIFFGDRWRIGDGMLHDRCRDASEKSNNPANYTAEAGLCDGGPPTEPCSCDERCSYWALENNVAEDGSGPKSVDSTAVPKSVEDDATKPTVPEERDGDATAKPAESNRAGPAVAGPLNIMAAAIPADQWSDVRCPQMSVYDADGNDDWFVASDSARSLSSMDIVLDVSESFSGNDDDDDYSYYDSDSSDSEKSVDSRIKRKTCAVKRKYERNDENKSKYKSKPKNTVSKYKKKKK